MTIRISLLLALGPLLACASAPRKALGNDATVAHTPAASGEDPCDLLFRALEVDDTARAWARFDTEMKHAVPLPQLDGLWKNLFETLGPLGGWSLRTRETAGRDLVRRVYGLDFEKGTLLARVTYRVSSGRIAGLLLLPDEKHVSYDSPPGARFRAEEIQIRRPGFVLAGTLLTPEGPPPFPAVLLQTGSGQQTRDEPLPIPGLSGYRPFRQIAESLAARGIAVLRVDDRGVGESTGASTLATATTADFADDARAEVAWLRGRRDLDPTRIAIVGHSEGADIAEMAAASDPGLHAVVLLAGRGEGGMQILEYQLRAILAEDPSLTPDQREKRVAEQQAKLRAVKDGRNVTAGGQPGPWLHGFLNYDPLAEVRRVKQPLLILQGALDRQVPARDARALAEAAKAAGNANVAVRVFPDLNHLFLPAKTGAISEYPRLASTRLPAEVLDALGAWLVRELRARPPPAR